MANYATLKAAIADVVKTNGSQAITGDNLQQVLLSIVNSIGGGYLFKGVATPSTDVGTPDQNVFYIGGAGTYGNFGASCTVPVGSIGIFSYNGSWSCSVLKLYDGVDDKPIENSDNLVKSGGVYKHSMDFAENIENGFIVYDNHMWNRYFAQEIDTFEFQPNWIALIVPVPEDAVRFYIDNGGVYSRAYLNHFPEVGVNCYGTEKQSKNNTTNVIFDGTKYVVINLKKENNPNFDAKAVKITFDIFKYGYTTSLAELNGKKVSILGASNETFGDYSYGYDTQGNIEQNNRYPGTVVDGNDVVNVDQTWWMQVIKRCNASLERNNSIGSSSVSRNGLYGKTCYLDRYNDLGEPDVILTTVGVNEPADISVSEFDPTIPTEQLDEYDFTQSHDKLMRLLINTYSNARIVVFSSSTNEVRNTQLRNIVEYYNLEYIEYKTALGDALTYITTDTVHPDSKGMSLIADYTISRFEVKYRKDVAIEASIALKSEKSPYDDPDVLVYYADETGKVFAKQYSDGSIEKMVLTKEEKKNKSTLAALSSDAPHNDDNILKYLTDENNACFGYIEKDGTVVIYKAKIYNYEDEKGDVTSQQFSTAVSLLANGLDNVQLSNNPKFMATLHNLFGNGEVEINRDNNNNVNLRPCLSIIDDDTIDYQIPISRGTDSPVAKEGGFFSLLLPFMLSLGKKYNRSLCPGLACEGHRIGLTPIWSSDDTYRELNENGRAVKWLHETMGWNVFNHSMTAQLPMQAYYVDGIDSPLAQRILNENDYWSIPYGFQNCIVLDRTTGKWYEVNNRSKYTWVERTPTKKYAMPFYRDYDTKQWYFNRDFDFDYSWGEWFKRADELGFPYEKVIVHNGGTSSVYMAYGGRKYAYWSVRTQGTHNYPPIPATVNRIASVVGDNNVRNASYEQRLMSEIDYCFEHNTWMAIMTHFNEEKHRNYYLDGVEYPDGDSNYPTDWIIPLNYNEILDIIGDNVHDYINHPPSRLNINSWEEWHPAPGTQLKSLYDVIDYALAKGVDFVSPMQGWNTHGNILNIGIDRNNQKYGYDSASAVVPYTDDEKSYLTIGADMSIRYYNSKK